MNIIEALDAPDLFAPLFRDGTWSAWRVFLAALFGLAMSDADQAVFRHYTERETPPTAQFREAALVIGRRGGKSRVLALIAIFLALFVSHAAHLVAGEIGVIAIVASDRRQGRILLRYIIGTLHAVPSLAAKIVRGRELAESVELSNGVTIEIHTGTIASPRGRTFVAVLCDEIAFWRSEDSANPDADVIAAVRPGLASIPGSMLLQASSPYAKKGVLYTTFRRHYGVDTSRTLVWRGTTEEMNPTIDPQLIADAMEDDPASAASEYYAQFRDDIAAFVAREIIDAVTPPGRYELPPLSTNQYVAFVDPSGGSSDSMTLAIAHRSNTNVAILDAVREVRPPFSPEGTVQDFAVLLKSYRVRKVTGDRYAGEWPRERFREHGVEYEISEHPKSDIYRDVLPLLNSGKVELLDLTRLTTQFCSLERRVSRGGRDSIDHPPGAHDDIANSVAGALLLVGAKRVMRINAAALTAMGYRHATAPGIRIH